MREAPQVGRRDPPTGSGNSVIPAFPEKKRGPETPG